MATYHFETMSSADGAAFTAVDTLIFVSASITDLGIVDRPGPTGDFPSENFVITYGAISLGFDAASLSNASRHGGVQFLATGDAWLLGTRADDNGDKALTAGGTAGHHALVQGFGGADLITGGPANDTLDGGTGNDTIIGASTAREADYLFGGDGADSIVGGDGNDHIFGNSASTTAGSSDGNDTISAGAGSDYVNGNAGNDVIDGGPGKDRLYGGAGDDTINGGPGDDYIQGNKGNDSLEGGSGSDTLHGGQGDDQIIGGDFHKQAFLYGDAGDDWLTGAAYAWLEGGPGRDQFFLYWASDNNLASAMDAPDHGLVSVIGDYVHGEDHINLALPVRAVLHPATGMTFATPEDALSYANQLLAGTWHRNETDVAAISVGEDTYIFFQNYLQPEAVNAVVRLVGIHDSALDLSDFPV